MTRQAWAAGAVFAFALTVCAESLPTPQTSDKSPPDCSSGVVMDDGDPESGYGFVPSATEGIYLQRFDAADFPRPQLRSVCVCMLKTRGASDADFEVVFYKDVNGRPAAEPYATFPVQAKDLPRTKETAGRFYPADVSGVVLPPGKSFIGARWDPSKQAFLFICTDTSEKTEKVDVFYREDIMTTWAHVDQSRDPIFRPHKSILVRAVAATADEAAKQPRFLQGSASSTPELAPPEG